MDIKKIVITGDSWTMAWLSTVQGHARGFPLFSKALSYFDDEFVVEDYSAPGSGNFASFNDAVSKIDEVDYLIHFFTDPVRDYGELRELSVITDRPVAEKLYQKFVHGIQNVKHYKQYIDNTTYEFYTRLQKVVKKFNCKVLLIGGCHPVNTKMLFEFDRIISPIPNLLEWYIKKFIAKQSPFKNVETVSDFYIARPNWVHLLDEKCNEEFINYVYEKKKTVNEIQNSWDPENLNNIIGMWPDSWHINASGLLQAAFHVQNIIRNDF